MAISIYLAASAAQISKMERFPKGTAWMACHFSASSSGLSNCPKSLPPGSLLILDDSAPIQDHDPERVRTELETLLANLSCSALLLDFQRPGGEEMASVLSESLPCPVAVTDRYAHLSSGPVLLPPIPAYILTEKHLRHWNGREIWLELAKESCEIRLTEAGAALLGEAGNITGRHHHDRLHCHYDIQIASNEVTFRLHRDTDDLSALLRECEAFGVTTAVGLLQEFPELEK